MDALIAPRTGFRIRNPVIAASGVFGYGVEFAERMDLAGLGAIVSKGTTRRPRAGNEPLRLLDTPAGMLNAIGLQNIGVEAVISEKAPVWARWDTPVLVNVSGNTTEEYVSIVSMLDGVPGVAGVELNISCPNVKEGGIDFGVQPDLAFEVTAAARSATSLPLIVKLSPNVTDIRPIASAVEAAGADAVSLVNTVYGMAIDRRHRAPSLSNVSGGLSGPAIKPLALHLVYTVAAEVTVPVVGIGGILTWQDAVDFLLAGATAVQLGTALLADPTCWRSVVRGIERWLAAENVRTLGEVVGAANPGFKRRTGEVSLTGRD